MPTKGLVGATTTLYQTHGVAHSLKERVFCEFVTQNTVPCCQKYTSIDSFFGDFAHWDGDGSCDLF